MIIELSRTGRGGAAELRVGLSHIYFSGATPVAVTGAIASVRLAQSSDEKRRKVVSRHLAMLGAFGLPAVDEQTFGKLLTAVVKQEAERGNARTMTVRSEEP